MRIRKPIPRLLVLIILAIFIIAGCGRNDNSGLNNVVQNENQNIESFLEAHKKYVRIQPNGSNPELKDIVIDDPIIAQKFADTFGMNEGRKVTRIMLPME
ncbi:hypothetical protein [Paenibacillus sp. J22TS3]|uniref:hypothetical protein n=1 Tax=Paenibacillus sp. J22TS3 TaxID=2807192 RepID=UPI001B1FBBE3|nr:hypothetical protein [Paenibacillus sp. J22TS3]GIP24173.1 hypothetical protein J22TS3_44480 [Paenibacillus sp. J22TS3]